MEGRVLDDVRAGVPLRVARASHNYHDFARAVTA
jgi:hypothetical protein